MIHTSQTQFRRRQDSTQSSSDQLFSLITLAASRIYLPSSPISQVLFQRNDTPTLLVLLIPLLCLDIHPPQRRLPPQLLTAHTKQIGDGVHPGSIAHVSGARREASEGLQEPLVFLFAEVGVDGRVHETTTGVSGHRRRATARRTMLDRGCQKTPWKRLHPVVPSKTVSNGWSEDGETHERDHAFPTDILRVTVV
jgi:hypothetical protein